MLTEPLPLLVCKSAFNRVDRLFAVGKLHFHKEENVAERIIFPITNIDIEIVQLNGVVGFEFEMNGLRSTPALRIDWLIAFELARSFA